MNDTYVCGHFFNTCADIKLKMVNAFKKLTSGK